VWRVLWGHRAPVTSLAVTALHDTVLSASTTGTVLVHSLIKGRILHRLHLQPPSPSPSPPASPPPRTLVAAVALSAVTGAMVVHTVECKPLVRPGSTGARPATPAEDKDGCLVAFSHNGERLDTCTVRGVLHTLQAVSDERLLCGGVRDGVSIRCLRTLRLLAVLHVGGVARAVSLPASGDRVGPTRPVGVVVHAALSPDAKAVLALTDVGAVLCYLVPCRLRSSRLVFVPGAASRR